MMYAKCKRIIKSVAKAFYLAFRRIVNILRVLTSPDYKRLKESGNIKRIILLDTPEHGNLGDHAIVLAQKEFLKKKFPGVCQLEFTQRELHYAMKIIKRYISYDDILVIPGGGFVGTLWMNEEEMLIKILKEFKQNKIIIFPQTVYFENTLRGKAELDKLQSAIKSCSYIKIFVRDQRSYDVMVEKMEISKQQCFLVPDIVTWLKPEMNVERQKCVMFCFREDKEKLSHEKWLKYIMKCLEEYEVNVINSSTVIQKNISKQERYMVVNDKLEEFASVNLVLTDRLHGMIFAAITGTPCVAVDNVSQKVSGSFEWLKHLSYIECIQDDTKEIFLDKKLHTNEKWRYSNDVLEPYYQIIAKEISNCL